MKLKLSKTEKETIKQLEPKEIAILLRRPKDPIVNFKTPGESGHLKNGDGWVEITYLGQRQSPSEFTIDDIICEDDDKLTLAKQWFKGDSNLHVYTVVRKGPLTRNQLNILDHFVEYTWDVHVEKADIETLEDYKEFIKVKKVNKHKERPYCIKLLSPIPDYVLADYWKVRYDELLSVHDEMRDRLKSIVDFF